MRGRKKKKKEKGLGLIKKNIKKMGRKDDEEEGRDDKGGRVSVIKYFLSKPPNLKKTIKMFPFFILHRLYSFLVDYAL